MDETDMQGKLAWRAELVTAINALSEKIDNEFAKTPISVARIKFFFAPLDILVQQMLEVDTAISLLSTDFQRTPEEGAKQRIEAELCLSSYRGAKMYLEDSTLEPAAASQVQVVCQDKRVKDDEGSHSEQVQGTTKDLTKVGKGSDTVAGARKTRSGREIKKPRRWEP
ncbi:hypothetical protein GE061_011271 [Apolygus lucorum]|uniref:Uncharacterized protein n=1 Tax=Apolygus lucorum TaxID=248454 RepID=A0A6A4K835_APOLU|nr:hypothetical protein GE061_011271 [Apolygus lucorum]